MIRRLSRRNLMQAAGATAFAPSFEAAAAAPAQWPVGEGPNTPHINMGGGRDEAGMRRIKQLGVDYVTGGGVGGPLPWKEGDIRAAIERCKAAGLTLYNVMIAGFNKAIYGRPGRDEEIDKIRQSIQAAGKAGLPVIEYNFGSSVESVGNWWDQRWD